nr:hypothetical protein [Cyanobacteria bacterium UBA8530]
MKNFPVRLRVKDPSDAVLFDKFLTTDAFGAYHDSLTLPEEAVIGDYSIEAMFGKASDYAHFKVMEYRKPEYKLDVKTDKSFYLGGETIKATVTANYYFGSPVTGSKVNYTIYSTPIYGNSAGKNDEMANLYFGFTDSEEFSWGYGDVVAQGEAVTDGNGRISLSVPTKRIEAAQAFEQTYDQRYTLEVEAVDSSRRPVKGKGSALVARGLVQLSATLEESVVAPNQPVRLLVRATDREGRPLSDKKIKISAFEEREIPGEGERKITFFPLFEKEGKTKQGGLSEELKFPKEGQYDIAVSTIDEAGNTVSEQVWLWVASGDNSGYESARYGSMRFFFDKKVYRPGEKAKIILSAPIGNVPVLLTREGANLEEAQVIQMKAPNKLIEIPITR